MWFFLVSELRAGNSEAKKRGPKIWMDYKRVNQTDKNPPGLDSHFRKMMIPNVQYSELKKPDMFLLLRLYKAELTETEKDMLEAKFKVHIEESRDGVFEYAIDREDNTTKYPNYKERADILNESLDDSDGPEDIEHVEPQSKEDRANKAREDKLKVMMHKRYLALLSGKMKIGQLSKGLTEREQEIFAPINKQMRWIMNIPDDAKME